MIYDTTFGVIPLQKNESGWQVYLVQHQNSFWGFPKGHLEEGETPQQCATRELKEETHLDVVCFLSNEPLKEEFVFKQNGADVFKTIYYFLAEVGGHAQLVNDQEIMFGTWVALSDAASVMTHVTGKELCQLVEKMMREKSNEG